MVFILTSFKAFFTCSCIHNRRDDTTQLCTYCVGSIRAGVQQRTPYAATTCIMLQVATDLNDGQHHINA